MKRPHKLKETLENINESYDHLRDYALGHGLAVGDKEEYILLARIREKLNQSKGIVDGIESRV